MNKKILTTIICASTILASCSGGKSGDGSGAAVGGNGVDNESATATATPGYVGGVAAIGAPLGFANVTITGVSGACATTALTGMTNTLGVYSVNVDGCNSPYLIKVSASNGEVSTIAFEPGKIANVTPLTQLIAQRASGSKNLSTSFSSVTSQALTDAQTQIKTVLKDYAVAVGAATSVAEFQSDATDLLSGVFSANGQGLDKLLDLIKVENTGSTTSEIMIGTTPIVVNIPINSSSPVAPIQSVVDSAAVVGNIKASKLATAKDFAKRLTAIFKDGAPSDAAISEFVTSDYLHFGQSKAILLAEFAEDKNIKGIEFKNVVILNDDSNDFWVVYQIFGKENGKNILWNTWATKISDPDGTPKMMGNRLPFILQPTYIKVTDYNTSNVAVISYIKSLRLGIYGGNPSLINFNLKKIADSTVDIKVTGSLLDQNYSANSTRYIHNQVNEYIKITDAEASETISKIVFRNLGQQTDSVSYILMPTRGLEQPNPYPELTLPAFNVSGGSCAWTKTRIQNAAESEFILSNQFNDDSFGSILMHGDQQTMIAYGDDNPVEKFVAMIGRAFSVQNPPNDFKLDVYYVGQYGVNDIRYDHLYRCN